ncbi:MAG: hypothetical protein QXW97_02975 [Candidatus Pacearchaeota archaeon]
MSKYHGEDFIYEKKFEKLLEDNLDENFEEFLQNSIYRGEDGRIYPTKKQLAFANKVFIEYQDKFYKSLRKDFF